MPYGSGEGFGENLAESLKKSDGEDEEQRGPEKDVKE